MPKTRQISTGVYLIEKLEKKPQGFGISGSLPLGGILKARAVIGALTEGSSGTSRNTGPMNPVRGGACQASKSQMRFGRTTLYSEVS
jgi:hypothetical protein